MLVSSRLPPPPTTPRSSMTIYDNNNNNNNNQINSSTSVPKYFNVPFAIQHGYFRCVRYLLQLDYDPNERDGQLRTPLILCSYVENDRWSLSLAQNLLEKGAKIALEDHARRNAMHHACALQRLHLVQLYLSCLDFNLEAKDCEGNTCLHYVAITGNCEIAELLIKSAEKLGVRLDQYVNREGCSAAVLALKYGHIECANQITHRDWDEFFVIPRPLSIYETPPTTEDNQTSITTVTTTTTTPVDVTSPKKKCKTKSYHSLANKSEIRPSTLSFGLLKIIFNDSDTGYSTRLAGLCKLDKQFRHRQHLKHKKQEALQTSTTTINKFDRTKSTLVNTPNYCSTEALVNETQSSHLMKENQINLNSNGTFNRTSPRLQLLMQQQHLSNKTILKDKDNNTNSSFIQKTQLSIDDIHKTKSNFFKNDTEDLKSKLSIVTMYRQTSNSTLTHSENNSSKKFQRPTTSIIHNQTFNNTSPTRLNSAKVHIISPTTKKKPLLNDRINSASNVSKHQSTRNSSARHPTRPITSVVHHSPPRSNPSTCSIREAKGTANRYNKPEELFGVRPEELFNPEQYQPKILDQRSGTKTDDNTRSKRHQFQQQQHIWQQDVDKIIELYNIHHCANYRKSAIPPPITSTQGHTDTLTDFSQNSRPRRTSISKNSTTNLKPPTNPKQSTLATLNIPRRNSISRPSVKLTNT